MPKANQSINAFLGYPNNNIEITEKLGLLVGVKLIAPAPECMKWSTEEEAELRFQKKMSSDSWTHQHQGHRFYFEKQDGSELIAIFDRSYGFILPDEYKELMSRRSNNRSVFIDMKPTKLFLELSNVHSFKQSEALNSRSQ